MTRAPARSSTAARRAPVISRSSTSIGRLFREQTDPQRLVGGRGDQEALDTARVTLARGDRHPAGRRAERRPQQAAPAADERHAAPRGPPPPGTRPGRRSRCRQRPHAPAPRRWSRSRQTARGPRPRCAVPATTLSGAGGFPISRWTSTPAPQGRRAGRLRRRPGPRRTTPPPATPAQPPADPRLPAATAASDPVQTRSRPGPDPVPDPPDPGPLHGLRRSEPAAPSPPPRTSHLPRAPPSRCPSRPRRWRRRGAPAPPAPATRRSPRRCGGSTRRRPDPTARRCR